MINNGCSVCNLDFDIADPLKLNLCRRHYLMFAQITGIISQREKEELKNLKKEVYCDFQNHEESKRS